jgi:hypothetical protein
MTVEISQLAHQQTAVIAELNARLDAVTTRAKAGLQSADIHTRQFAAFILDITQPRKATT